MRYEEREPDEALIIDLHQCMLDFGYYDYAHFSKDFKLCLGITPAEYKSWMQRKFAALGEARDVGFLQDEP
ncbi:hypothetical protein FE783_19170 [Paenibacillus mesophilus]|uniref:hypothetical protein n=1 Tax=Paenibacillus mesophilus TaxID=2582849 RepID=UPI00110F4070|nr:hypothetical protein [Paenibacillus mesophilus]TMV48080.1 hypothetical protein FE783_19170 [Paenibacillus mesophilus]